MENRRFDLNLPAEVCRDRVVDHGFFHRKGAPHHGERGIQYVGEYDCDLDRFVGQTSIEDEDRGYDEESGELVVLPDTTMKKALKDAIAEVESNVAPVVTVDEVPSGRATFADDGEVLAGYHFRCVDCGIRFTDTKMKLAHYERGCGATLAKKRKRMAIAAAVGAALAGAAYYAATIFYF